MATHTELPNASAGQPRVRESVIDRLLRKVRIDANSQCWNWMASKDTHGYGHLKICKKIKLSHRISYELHCGPIPNGLHVLHKCDNRACINPEHLFLGTNADNVADKLAKGRQPHNPNLANRGSSSKQSKITESDAAEIKAAIGVPQLELAKRFGISVPLISRIRSGKRWHHI